MPEETTDPERDEIDRAKSVLRLHARAARRAVLPEERVAHSYAIAERALALPEIASASSALLYGASPEEADPGVLEFALRERGVRVAYPRVAGPRLLTIHWVDSPALLVPGAFGLKEPIEHAPSAHLDQMSVIVVPGVAFDEQGNRLGFGGGFYDSLLGSSHFPPASIGIAYDEQVFRHIPHEDRDHPVDIVLTPTRTVRIERGES